MLNKRLLIKNLLAHSSENSFYDKKRQLNLQEREGKAKFLKHVCALANSNLHNKSFMVIGVEDADNQIRGVDFFDDSKIQNLINAYLENPPMVAYENISFPHLPDDLVVGLVTIKARNEKTCYLKKSIWKYPAGSSFFREGSISVSSDYGLKKSADNRAVVTSIENHSQNNIELTLDGVFSFFKKHENLQPKYKVFKEYFVVCWSGIREDFHEKEFYSRVDIELINEQVKLFYSALDQVIINISEDSFSIQEFVRLGLHNRYKYYPLEEVSIHFKNSATYEIKTQMLFEPPQFDRKTLHHIYNANQALIAKLKKGSKISASEEKDLYNLPATFLLCYFNGFEEAIEQLEAVKELLRNYDAKVFQLYKDSMRILRKVKYN